MTVKPIVFRATALAALLLAGPAVSAELSYEQAKANADRDEAALSPAFSQRLSQSQGKAIGDVLSVCMFEIPHPGGHPDVTPFVVVMQLDAFGRIVRTWRQGSTPLAVCFHREIGRKMLFAPPKAPFYTSIELALTEKDAPGKH